MFRKRLESFNYAFKGLADLVRTQPNASVHLFIAALVLLGGFFLALTPLEWALIGLTICLVLAAEAFNTSLEYLTDLASPDIHPLAGKAKDVAAAGVLLTALGAVIVGLCIFGPKLWAHL